MQRAAAGLAAAADCAGCGRVYGARVVLLVGGGDNGGDALYAGALLARRGAAVTALAIATSATRRGRRRAPRPGSGFVTAGDAER